MGDLLVVNAKLGDQLVSIDIEKGVIGEIRPQTGIIDSGNLELPPLVAEEDDVDPFIHKLRSRPLLNARGLNALPPFYNTHTHAAMSLLRGYADDLELFDWLQNHIWPLEAKLTAGDIFAGTRLAILEMIRSGSVFFNDMYWHPRETIRAVQSVGMRASIGQVILDAFDEEQGKRQFEDARELVQDSHTFGPKISLSIAPHAIYTVRPESLQKAAEFAAEHDITLHIHLAETRKEVEECQSQNNCSPVEWLLKNGAFQAKTVAAHAIHLSENDIRILADNQVHLSHNPVSNSKLLSGSFPWQEVRAAGISMSLGTDSSSSNNNLDMLEVMKAAAFNAKARSGDPMAGSAEDVWDLATKSGALAFNIDGGELAPGKVGDLILVDTDNPRMVPGFNLISDMVYSADSSVVDSVVCGGKVLMENQQIPDQEEIIEQARESARRLTRK